MKQIESQRQFNFSCHADEMCNITKDFLLANGFVVTGDTKLSNGISIHAKRGSETQLRLLGSLLTTPKQLPIKVNIKINNDNRIDVFFSSDFDGIGSSFGLVNRFNKLYNELCSSYEKSLC